MSPGTASKPDYTDEIVREATRRRQRPRWTFAPAWVQGSVRAAGRGRAGRGSPGRRACWCSSRRRWRSRPSRSSRASRSCRRRSGWRATGCSRSNAAATSSPSIPRPGRRRRSSPAPTRITIRAGRSTVAGSCSRGSHRAAPASASSNADGGGLTVTTDAVAGHRHRQHRLGARRPGRGRRGGGGRSTSHLHRRRNERADPTVARRLHLVRGVLATRGRSAAPLRRTLRVTGGPVPGVAGRRVCAAGPDLGRRPEFPSPAGLDVRRHALRVPGGCRIPGPRGQRRPRDGTGDATRRVSGAGVERRPVARRRRDGHHVIGDVHRSDRWRAMYSDRSRPAAPGLRDRAQPSSGRRTIDGS